ncbi:hypothetical protein [Bacteriovorax sp. DB6_IX]|uniref:hypothetical protein n=1 Tax=Bacteriovorax sp. DB6_IX TaxID=1353530 RepID=UPI0012FC5EE2|nr:hypothetical protein [Bacteriovorax sp. DB6_IX]
MKWFVVLITALMHNFLFAYNYQDLSSKYEAQAQAFFKDFQYKDYQSFYRQRHESHLVDQVYLKGESQFFIKIGLRAEKSETNKFLKHRDLIVYNTHFSNIPVAISFKKMNSLQRRSVLRSLKSYFRYQKLYSLIELFIPSAQAQDCMNQMAPIVDVENLTAPVQKFNRDYLMSQATGCVQKALSGAWDRTGGVVEDIGRGLWNFIKSPIKSAGEFWDKAVDTYKVTKEFVTKIDEKMAALGDALGSLTLESQVQLVCSLVGNIGGSVLLGVITGGPAGLANAMSSLASMTNRVVKATKALSILDKLKYAKKIGNDKFEELINKMLTTNKTVELDRVNELANNNMTRLTMEYASCAL